MQSGVYKEPIIIGHTLNPSKERSGAQDNVANEQSS